MQNSGGLFLNPQQTVKAIMTKSFLPKRQSKRQMGTGSQFFQDNRIRSCSYVKETKGGLKAIPYYDKRQKSTTHGDNYMKKSWTSQTHSNKGIQNAGMGTRKLLKPYDPKAPRSLMNIPSFRPPYPNSSHIQFGTRTARDNKHFTTNYQNNMLFEGKHIQTSHPGIQAAKNKWLRSRLQK